MKKIFAFASGLILFALTACNNSNTNDVTTADTTGSKNPDGMVNSSVISTDSAAYRTDTAQDPQAKELVDSIF